MRWKSYTSLLIDCELQCCARTSLAAERRMGWGDITATATVTLMLV